jgi:type IV pilus assembly protein PilE
MARGFSLLEMLVALVIIGILTAISYPSYQRHILRSYRAEAITQLLQLANAQEQHLADHGSYTNDLGALGAAAANDSLRYRYSIQIADAGRSFILTADVAGLQRADSDCTVFTLNQYGQRNLQNPNSLACWY